MRSDERRAQTEAAREQLQAKLDELQRRFDERAAALGRTRKSLLRGNPNRPLRALYRGARTAEKAPRYAHAPVKQS